jgi:1-acyl-sn-glycerol-3-phosphate acyltransferase
LSDPITLGEETLSERPLTGEAAAREAGGWRRRGFKVDTSDLSLHSPIRATLLILPYLLITLLIIPLQVLLIRLHSRWAERLPVIYHRGVCWLFGLDIVVHGKPESRRPTLFIGNHTSYIDIEVLSSLMPVSFIAKAEVGRWPFFGTLARLQRTVFVDRRPQSTVNQRDEIAARLAAGDNLMLFPEGTSNDGNRTLPFYSALFSVAERRIAGERPLPVQPVSVAYSELNGFPIGRSLRPLLAWYGDMELAPHLWCFAGLGRVKVVVEFHPTVTIDEFASRKELAEHCRRAIARGVADAISGRTGDVPVPGDSAAGLA